MDKDICRICLAVHAPKNVCDPEATKGKGKSFLEIFSFCLGIEVTEDTKVSTKLCLKCYKKVLIFNKFKVLAQKSDAYLKSLVSYTGVKHEIFVREEEPLEILNNNAVSEKNDFTCDTILTDTNLNQTIKLEAEEIQDNDEAFDSDNELLSVIKKIKNEYDQEVLESDPQKSVQKTKIKKKKELKKMEMCDECGKEVRDLKGHMKRHQSPQQRKEFKCEVCGKVFSSYGARHKHNKSKHLGIKKHCNICDKDIVNMRYHVLMHHSPEALKFECALCSRKFITRSKYEEHVTLHTKDKQFECPECGKRFRLRNVLIMHRRQVHLKEKSHLCQFCSKSFFKKYHLQIHIRSHTKEKPHECPDCGKFFSSTTVLKNHRETHSADRKYHCLHCDAKFNRKSNLYTHIRTHSKEKPHICKYCGVGFRRSDHCKRHQYTAHEKHMALPSDFNLVQASEETNAPLI